MNEDILNGLYYFKKEGHQYVPVKCDLFNDEELFRINASVQIMKRFFKNLERSIAAKNSYDEFINAAKAVKSDNPYTRADVDRRFRAFIFEWKLYTEHWKKYIQELSDSVYLDDYVNGYNDLFKSLMDEAFKDKRFVTAHVIRNYVSHANEAVTHCHIGEKNKYCIYRATLVSFLDESISKANGRKKSQLESQKAFIQTQEELINLECLAAEAMAVLQWFESNLMNYQIEPQTLQAVNILTNAKKRIDEAGIESEIWEILSSVPLMMVDHTGNQAITLETTLNGEKIRRTVYRDRLNWIGYQAVMSYIMNLVERAKSEGNPSVSNAKGAEQGSRNQERLLELSCFRQSQSKISGGKGIL